MAHIRIKLDAALMDGHNVTFKAPCDCTAIDGLKVCYIENNSLQEKIFSMKDTHGNALAGLGNLFAAGSYVHAILDSVNCVAYLQNADTNGYLENKLNSAEAAIAETRARMDSFVTLPEGSTTGDAELIDARIGADNVTYSNLGTAIRTQFANMSTKHDADNAALKENMAANVNQFSCEIDEISEDFRLGIVGVLNASLNNADKALSSNNNCRTIYAECKPNTTYTIEKKTGGRFVVGCINTIPTETSKCTKTHADNAASKIIFETDETASYIVAFVYYSSTDSNIGVENMLNSCVIYEGTFAKCANDKYARNEVDIISKATNELKMNVGTLMPLKGEKIILTRNNGNIITKNIGNVITFGTQDYYSRFEIDVVENESYYLSFLTTNSETARYVYFTNDNDVIVGYVEGYVPKTYYKDFLVTIPKGCTKMHFWSYSNESNSLNDCCCIKGIFADIQSQITKVQNDVEKINVNMSGVDDEEERYINKVCRIGYMPYISTSPPEQSLASYRKAYEEGYRFMLFDVRVTADGQFVCWHDATINNCARNTDGSEIVSEVYIANSTLEELDQYDFGIYRGEKYAGTKILRMKDILNFCRILNLKCRIEFKASLTEEEQARCINEIKQYYGFNHEFVLNGDLAALEWLASMSEHFPKSIVAIGGTDYSKTFVDALVAAGLAGKAFVGGANAETLTDEFAQYALSKNIFIGFSEIKTGQDLEYFWENNVFKYCTFISSQIDFYDFIKRKALEN